MYEDGKGLLSIEVTADQLASIADWSELENRDQDNVIQWIVDRGFVAVEHELNQRWINRDIRSGVLNKYGKNKTEQKQ